MDTGNKHSSGAVDDILEELRGSPRRPAGSGADVDDILAELGVGTKPTPAAVRPAAPAAPRAATAQPPAPEAQPPAPRPAPSAAPRPQPAAPSAPKPKKQPLGDTTILDIEVAHTQGMERVGKAAALDRVDREKFSGDEELLSWFSGEEGGTLSRKEQRRMEKERKKQEAADRRAGKKKNADYEPDAEDELPPLPSLDFAAGAGGEEERVAKDSAEDPIDQNPDEWTVSGDLFADAPAQGAPPKAPEPVRPAAAGAPTGAQRPVPKMAPAAKPAAPAPKAAPAAPKAAPLAPPPAPVSPDATQAFSAPLKIPRAAAEGETQVFSAAEVEAAAKPAAPKLTNTQTYELEEGEEPRVPTAAFTQEFDNPEAAADPDNKSLFVDDMVDDKFRAFFGETVAVDKEEMEGTRKRKRARARTKASLFTGEFAQLEEQMAQSELDEPPGAELADDDDYSRPQDAEAVEAELVRLRKSHTVRLGLTGGVSLLLLWLALAYHAVLPVPAFMAPVAKPVAFGVVYLVLVLAAIVINFKTVASGLVGLALEPTVDSAPALAGVGALLQAVVVLLGLVTTPGEANVTLFGWLAGLVLCLNLVGNLLRSRTILKNFQLASAGFDHSAAYIVDGARHELAYNITDGLEEDDPVLLISRPTALVKGFLRQSFSRRWSDGIGRIIGWVLVGVGLAVAVVSFVLEGDALLAISCFAAALCIGAPFSSSLVSAVPSLLMQQGTSKVGAVVPGWSAIEELGDVNVVMAGARDIFPPSSVQLRGIKTYQKERIDIAILYAASVLIEGCDTMRDIFSEVIQGKSDMLYKVESLTVERARGFTAWVENHRVVIGTREMLQKHDITPPPIESEMQYLKAGCLPVYLAVSGKLFAMFVVKYTADEEVAETLQSLVQSGVSVLVTSDDMNVTAELIQSVYSLPQGVVKVLGARELDILEPMTSYIPESEGVMTHIGSFTSFIGGMSAAANCAASERMCVIIQLASVALAGVLSLVLAFSGGLASLSMGVALLLQLGWTVLISAVPFARRM